MPGSAPFGWDGDLPEVSPQHALSLDPSSNVMTVIPFLYAGEFMISGIQMCRNGRRVRSDRGRDRSRPVRDPARGFMYLKSVIGNQAYCDAHMLSFQPLLKDLSKTSSTPGFS